MLNLGARRGAMELLLLYLGIGLLAGLIHGFTLRTAPRSLTSASAILWIAAGGAFLLIAAAEGALISTILGWAAGLTAAHLAFLLATRLRSGPRRPA